MSIAALIAMLGLHPRKTRATGRRSDTSPAHLVSNSY